MKSTAVSAEREADVRDTPRADIFVDPRLPILDDAQALVNLVARITASPVSEVTQRLWREHEQLGYNVNQEFSRLGQRRGMWTEQLVEFYGTTDSFLYESIVWNRTAVKCSMRRWITEWIAKHYAEPARVLVYGDGLGFDSLYLSQAGHRVDYFEVSESCLQFAECIFAEHGGAPAIIRSPQNVPPAHYDIVVCLDVLEHVPEPGDIVRSLTAALRPGGHLMVHAPFWYLGRKVPTHLHSNRRFSGDVQQLYRPHGLEPVDGCLFWNPIVLRKRVGEGSALAKPTAGGIRLPLGGFLLSLARMCAIPHTLACEWVLAMNRPHWQDLQRLAKAGDTHASDAG